jgi:dihydroflavonol-4-reductase
MGRLAFVTGATGFIGRLLVEDLIAWDWKVRALVRSTSDTTHLRSRDVELIVADLTDRASLRDAVVSTDTVFHLAATNFARTEADYRAANVAGTQALVDAAVTSNPRPRRLVYLSSYAAVGPSDPTGCRSAELAPRPLTAYGRSKLAGEQVSKKAEETGLEVVVIRAPAVYGPGDRALLSYFKIVRLGIALAPAGADRKLHLVYGPDLASALRRAADVPPATYAVAEPVVHLWADIARTIATSMDRRPIRISLPSPAVRAAARATEAIGRLANRPVAFNREKAEEMLAPAWICDLAGSELLLPLAETTSLREGIDHTVRWYHRQGWL